MITIVDYGMGNLRSVSKGFERVGAKTSVTQDGKAIASASKLVLPGVGAFQNAVRNLEELRLTEPLLEFLKTGQPFLGICLGLQLLFTESEEGEPTRGFDLFKGRVRRFPNSALKVPHIGWNRVKVSSRNGSQKAPPLLEGIPDDSYFYFVHSYYVDPDDVSCVAARTDYGLPFTSMIWKDNIFATQFHPEKSQELGLRVLENFARL